MEIMAGSVIGGCRIEEKIGQGGMGTVYKAHHLALDIPVAVKIMTAITDLPDAQERFLREARIAAKLKHPNIAAVLNVGVEDGIHFLVMEYVEGENLRELVEKRGRLPEHEVRGIAKALAGALRKAYECGVIHRDIKPDNILFDTTGTVRLIDLGLARSTENTSLTQSNTVLGSPHYVAPEQAEKPRLADCRADIYSLGCTLYHLLSGNAPFPGSTVMEVLVNHIKSPVPRLTDVVPSVSKQLSSMVEKMMQKNPDNRYQSPDEILSVLSEMEAAETLHRKSHEKHRKRKHDRIIVAAGTVFLIAVTAGVVYDKLKTLYKVKIEPVQEQVMGKLHSEDSLPEAQSGGDSLAAMKPAPEAGRHEPEHVGSTAPKRKIVKTPPMTPVNNENEKGPKNDAKTTDPVIAAVKIGDTDALRRLIAEGLSPNGAAGAASTPLHEAVRRGLDNEVRILLENGADPNRRDGKGDTPLHYALREDAQYLCELLLRHGANPNMKDHDGKSPLLIARSVGTEVEKIVQKNGGK